MMRVLGLLLLLVAAGLAVGCRREAPPRPIPRPNLSAEEPQVVELVRARLEAVERAPRSAAAWRELAMVLDAHRYTADAESAYRAASELEPDPWLDHQLAVVIEMQRPDDPEALELHQRLQRAWPRSPLPHLRAGFVLQSAGRIEEAALSFRHAISLDSGLAIAHTRLGQALLAMGDPERASVHLQEAVSLGATDGPTLSSLAQARLRLGHAEEAAELARRAQRSPPTIVVPDPMRAQIAELGVSSRICLERGTARMDAGDHAAALPDLECAARGMPDQPFLLLRLATCYVMTGQPERAREPLARALAVRRELAGRVGPDDRDLTNLDLRISRYRLAFEQPMPSALPEIERAAQRAAAGDLEAAMEAMERAQRAGTLSIANRLGWARLTLATGDVDGALAMLEAVVAEDPGNADAHHLLGQVHELRGDPEAARARFRRALVLDPAHVAAADLERLR